MWTWVAAWSAKNNDPDGKDSFLGQLNYLILVDLQQKHSAIDAAVKRMDSAGEVAAYWDAKFEVSDGKARDKRVEFANGVLKAAADNGWASGISTVPSGDSSTSSGCEEQPDTGGTT